MASRYPPQRAHKTAHLSFGPPGRVNQLQLLKQEALVVYREFGVSGFYLGLGSRCVWSGAIIAGQFFLYDVFKGAFKVTAADLTQFLDMLSAYSVQ